MIFLVNLWFFYNNAIFLFMAFPFANYNMKWKSRNGEMDVNCNLLNLTDITRQDTCVHIGYLLETGFYFF